MNKQQLKTAVFFASTQGGDIQVVTSDGEVKFELGVVNQKLKGLDLVNYVDQTDEIKLVGGVTAILATGSRVRAQPGYTVVESGANPDFTPTNYTEAEVRLRKLMREANDATKALEKRQKSFAKAAEKMAASKPESAPEPEPVIEEPEPNPEPQPQPEPKPKGKPAE